MAGVIDGPIGLTEHGSSFRCGYEGRKTVVDNLEVPVAIEQTVFQLHVAFNHQGEHSRQSAGKHINRPMGDEMGM